MWFLLIQSIVLVLLAMMARFFCVFWKKKKLQGLDLGKFLEKRPSLRSQKRAFDRMIRELQQSASEEEQVMEKLGDLVERESIKWKLSTTYSLGRDGERLRSKSLLPLHEQKLFIPRIHERVLLYFTHLALIRMFSEAAASWKMLMMIYLKMKFLVLMRLEEEEESFSDEEISERVGVERLFLKHSSVRWRKMMMWEIHRVNLEA